jgi:iron complex outermembrane receptor protein
VFDADGSAAWFLEFAEDSRGWQASHESRFSYADPQWRAQFGWNVFVEDNFQRVPFSSEEGTFLQCASVLRGATPPVAGLACVNAAGIVEAAGVTALATGGRFSQVPYSSEFKNIGQNDAYSVFADTTWIPVPALELTAGVRVLIEQRKSGFTARVPRPALNPAALSLIPGQVDTAGLTFWRQESFAAVLPRFNALFRLSDDINVFATVSKGRRSPVVQLDAQRVGSFTSPRLQLVPEETVWNYEAGLKGSVGIVSGALGVYYQKYDGFQVSVVGPDGIARTQSAGTASNLGVEAELNIRPTAWLNVFGNVGYIDGGIDEDNSFAPQFSGARFRLQPEWQAAGGFTIDAPLGGGMRFFATPSVTHRSRIFFEVPNNLAISQGPVTLVNARAGVSFAEDRYELAGFIRNAFDEDFLLDAGNTGGAFGTPTFIPGEPRFYGAQLTARF